MDEMAKQVSTTVIGGFVISAIALLVIAVMVFGGGKFFKKTVSFVLFFEKSVKGLKVGAPVIFRGVEIGSVENVLLRADAEKMKVAIPVIIEVKPEQFQMTGKRLPADPFEKAKIMTDSGLRCQLTMESLVTGQLMVEMDFYPESQVRLSGIDMGYPELPTMPTELDQLADSLKKLPLEEIAEKLLSAVASVERTLNAPELMDTLRNFKTASENLNRLIEDADTFLAHVDRQIDPLSTGLQTTIGEARNLVHNADVEVNALSGKAQDALVSGKETFDQANQTLQTYNGLVDERSEIRKGIAAALSEIELAARSIRALTDYLEQHPEALLQGKGTGKGE